MKKHVDYIIVGLGLAGACLAVQLIRRGKKIAVFDLPAENRATAVAAGLFNPITGKRVVKTWKADELFLCLQGFYTEVQKDLNLKFYYPNPLYTPFQSIEEQNDWMSKSTDPLFSNYISQVTTSSTFGEEVNDPIGGILLNRCGYINTKIFLEGIRKRILETEIYRDENFDDRKLIVSPGLVSYEDLNADQIIFCKGIHQLDGKYFNELPLKALKGEVITINSSKQLNRIYNRGVYVINHGINEYKVGATYNLTDTKPGITASGREELEGKLKNFLKNPFTVAHQDWGIRPSTIDRRPLIGVHPNFENIFIFNGLGTKGVSLAPYFSDQLANYLIGKAKLDKEVNITRVKALYSKL